MRRAGLMLLVVMALLTGCAAVGAVENQAYALVLGVEDAPGGGIRLTIRIPRIGSSGPDAQAGKGEPYLVLSAAGEEGLPEAQTASERQYLGAAVFRDGRLAAQLDARDTLWLNLLTTRLDSFTYTCAGKDYALSCAKKPRRTVAFDGDGVRLGATLWLSSEDSATDEELEAVARDLSAALTDMIRRCQAMGLEPFGFAERAAAHFLTIGEWRAFDWRGRFPSAQVEVKVNILGSGG